MDAPIMKKLTVKVVRVCVPGVLVCVRVCVRVSVCPFVCLYHSEMTLRLKGRENQRLN